MRATLKFAVAAALGAALLAGPSVAQDVSQDPIYTTLDLAAGFQPDPVVVSVTAGGVEDASAVSDCSGSVATAPDVRLNYEAGGYGLYIGARAEEDVILLINLPTGEWICDDDSGGWTNALLSSDSPPSGQYDIWIGSYESGTNFPAELVISEIGPFGEYGDEE